MVVKEPEFCIPSCRRATKAREMAFFLRWLRMPDRAFGNLPPSKGVVVVPRCRFFLSIPLTVVLALSSSAPSTAQERTPGETVSKCYVSGIISPDSVVAFAEQVGGNREWGDSVARAASSPMSPEDHPTYGVTSLPFAVRGGTLSLHVLPLRYPGSHVIVFELLDCLTYAGIRTEWSDVDEYGIAQWNHYASSWNLTVQNEKNAEALAAFFRMFSRGQVLRMTTTELTTPNNPLIMPRLFSRASRTVNGAWEVVLSFGPIYRVIVLTLSTRGHVEGIVVPD